MIERQVIERVYDTANIVDVVSDYVSLKRRGANYIGLCPFHTERTGSFTVSPSKGIYKCFGCGEAGNVITFVQKIESCSFPEAVKKVAKKYGIEVVEKDRTQEEIQRDTERDAMFRLNDFARNWFEQQLWQTDEGQSVGLGYFRSRGLRDDIIHLFHLGYAPNRNIFLDEAKKAGFEEDIILKSGICSIPAEGDRTRRYDRFRDRVIFPWFNYSGKVVAFNGRIMRAKENTGKYVNSHEIEGIFEKRRELYGIFFAIKEITKQQLCYLVEGQLDVISMVQAGISNVVASSGTALTEQQVRLIKRYAKNIVIMYDADAAGVKAAKRAIDMFLSEGINVKLITMPEGEDPDSMTHKMSSEQFAKYLEDNQTDFVQYKINRAGNDVRLNPEKFGELVNEICQSIACIRDNISRSVFTQYAAQHLSIDEREIQKKVNSLIAEEIEKRNSKTYAETPPSVDRDNSTSETPTPSQTPAAPPQAQTSKRVKIEKSLVQILLRMGQQPFFTYDDGTACSVAQYVISSLQNDKTIFKDEAYRTIIDEYAAHDDEPDFNPELFFTTHTDPEIVKLASQLLLDRYQVSKIFDNDKLGKQQETNDNEPEEKNAKEQEEILYQLPKIMLQYKISIIAEMLEQIKSDLNDGQHTDQSETLLIRQTQLKQLQMQINAAIKKL